MIDFPAIESRLDHGSFLQEDMDALGMSGYVDVFQMRAAFALKKAIVDAEQAAAEAQRLVAARAAAEAIRVQQALENFQRAQALAEKAAAEAAVELAARQAAEAAEVQANLEKFKESLANNPNAKLT